MTQYFYPEIFRVNSLSMELVNRGHDVTVVTNFPQYPQGKIYVGYGYKIPYEKNWNGVKIERMKVIPRGKTKIGLLMNCISYVICGYKWARGCNEYYDAVYILGNSPATVGLPAIKYKNKFKDTKIYYNVQDLWPESVEYILGLKLKCALNFIDFLVKKIYTNSDKILCSSMGFIESIEKKGVDNSKLIYWPQFFDAPKLENLKKPDIYDDHFNIVFTGNIGFAQGLDLLIEAMGLIREKKIKCYFVGDGRAKESLILKTANMKLTNSVFFLDRVSEHEANEYIHHADLAYLSLSDNPALNLVIPAKMQTYLSCAVPILGVVKGQSAQIIEEAGCGVVCKYVADDISKQIKILMSNSNVDGLRNNAREYFLNNFTTEIVVDELEKIFRGE